VQRSGSDVSPLYSATVTRVFAAPRDLVFEVWTKAEHFPRWFGPHGAEIVACEIDARPGGILRFGHRAPDGFTLFMKGTFGEVVAKERLVFTLSIVDEHGQPAAHPMFPDWPRDVAVETTVMLADAADGTHVTIAHSIVPAEAAAHPATQRWLPLARKGAMQVLDRLGEHLSLAAAAKGPMT